MTRPKTAQPATLAAVMRPTLRRSLLRVVGDLPLTQAELECQRLVPVEVPATLVVDRSADQRPVDVAARAAGLAGTRGERCPDQTHESRLVCEADAAARCIDLQCP